jgi:hypothetical protein
MAAYQVIPATGGAWHVYPGGRKVFVRATARPAPQPAAQAPQAAQPPGQFTPDAQYYADQAQRLFQNNQQLASFDTAHTRDQTQLQEALRQMAVQQPRDEQTTRVNANTQGLFYSTTLGNRLSDVAKTYAQRQSQAQSAYQQAEDARTAARAALQQGYTLDDAAARAAAADRQIGRDQSAADAGALVAEPQTVPTVTAPRVALPRVARTVRQPTVRTRRPRRR